MNIKNRCLQISLVFSLIATAHVPLIASTTQPIQTKYFKYTKRTGRIIKHTIQTLGGALGLALSVKSLFAIKDNIEFINGFKIMLAKDTLDPDQKEDFPGYIVHEESALKENMARTIFCTSTGATLLYRGINGFKKEICPRFHLIQWVKNKLNNQHNF